MRNAQTYHRATGFAAVSAFATGGGMDTVDIHGTSSVDQISLNQDFGWYNGGGLTRYFEGFDLVDVYLDMSVDQHDENDVWYEFELIDEPI